MATERLYLADPYLTEFTATVTAAFPHGEGTAVILDRTAFYPAAGGQPFDTGEIDGIAVTAVWEDGENVVHLLPAVPEKQTVAGRINWQRRFDHMQQHAGQHIVSQAFYRLFQADTLSFHLGPDTTYIDLPLPSLTPEEAGRVEELANRVIAANRPIQGYTVPADTVASLRLRKPPVKNGDLRVIDITDFDLCACGGTHPARTGEIGLVKITCWERKNNALRVHFLCGFRALADYDIKHRACQEISRLLSAEPADLPAAVRKLADKSRSLTDALERARQSLFALEADQLREKGRGENPRIVSAVFPDRDIADIKELAKHLTAHPGTVALLGVRETNGNQGQLVFARSADLTCHMGELLKQALPLIAGRGGGSAAFAQGGGAGAAGLDKALALAESKIQTRPV